MKLESQNCYNGAVSTPHMLQDMQIFARQSSESFPQLDGMDSITDNALLAHILEECNSFSPEW